MGRYAHYALVALTKSGALDYVCQASRDADECCKSGTEIRDPMLRLKVCSQNVDGLHRRSGLDASRLSDLITQPKCPNTQENCCTALHNRIVECVMVNCFIANQMRDTWELHGNSYIETCSCCSPPMEFVRPYDVYSTEEVKRFSDCRHARTRTTQHALSLSSGYVATEACANILNSCKVEPRYWARYVQDRNGRRIE
eukprot:5274276-Amphidinium_carterae.1